jgi:hypothetical protein
MDHGSIRQFSDRVATTSSLEAGDRVDVKAGAVGEFVFRQAGDAAGDLKFHVHGPYPAIVCVVFER